MPGGLPCPRPPGKRPNHYGGNKFCPERNLPAGTMEMAVAANLASYAHDPSMIKALQERLPQLARRVKKTHYSHLFFFDFGYLSL